MSLFPPGSLLYQMDLMVFSPQEKTNLMKKTCKGFKYVSFKKRPCLKFCMNTLAHHLSACNLVLHHVGDHNCRSYRN